MRSIKRKRYAPIFLLLVLMGLSALGGKVLAEQVGGSPLTASTSRIKTIYDSLVSLSHGSDAAGSWGNWGAYWNRIRSAGEWVPSGNATTAGVTSGTTFYSNSRTQQTGTAAIAMDYSTQSLVIWDDYKNGENADGDSAGEESTWTNTATNVWKDARTSLYWSNSQGSLTNSFTKASCDFYTTTPRGSYAGADADCGNAINACGLLSLEAVTGGGAKIDWYLPSQKELMQAYLDGMYNKAGGAFTTTSYFWSSAELSDYANYAWYTTLNVGTTGSSDKGNSNATRCVRRD